MADLSDVTTYLAQQAALAVYPNGPTNPSIAPGAAGFSSAMDVAIYEGWPLPEELEADVLGKRLIGSPATLQPRANGPAAQVSVFPMAGTGREVYQIFDDVKVIMAPSFGLTVAVSGASSTSLNNQVSITGTPNPGEFVTIIGDRRYIFSAGGPTASAILAQLLVQAQVNYPGTTLQGPLLTVPASYQLDVRQGGVGLLGKVTHRQCQYVMITVWAPTHKARSVISKAIDTLIKSAIVVVLPDSSAVKIVGDRTTISDEQQNQSIYRRDLIYDCEYGTLLTFPGTTITSVTIPITVAPGATAQVIVTE
jgi:hypothetical protein